MKVIRLSAAGGLAAVALSVLLPAGAQATRALPEMGRCTQVAPGSGTYTSATCLKLASETKKPGEWEFKAIEATEVLEFEALGGETKLLTPGHPKIKCVSSTYGGKFTGAKTANGTASFQGCTNILGQTCQTSPEHPGTIESLPLGEEIGFIRNETIEGKTIVSVGMDFKPPAPLNTFAVYSCGASAETATIEGSVIGTYKPIDKTTREADLIFTTKEGKQYPEALLGGTPDTLTTTYTSGVTSTSAPTVLKAKALGATISAVSSPEAELKAIEK